MIRFSLLNSILLLPNFGGYWNVKHYADASTSVVSSSVKCTRKLSIEATSFLPPQLDWTSLVEQIGFKAQAGQSKRIDCTNFDSGASCRLSDYKAIGEISTLLFINYDSIIGTAFVEVHLASPKAESCQSFQENLINLALEVIPQTLNFQDFSWSIVSPQDNNHEASLQRLVLSSQLVKNKQRIKHVGDISIWSFINVGEIDPTTAVFIKDILRYVSSNEASSIAHAEAFVHPAMISHAEPKRVLLVSDMPYSALGEIVKYTTLEHVDVIGVSSEMHEILQTDLKLEQLLGDHSSKISYANENTVFSWAQAEIAKRNISLDMNDDDSFYACTENADNYQPETPEEYQARSIWLSTLCENDEFARYTKKIGYDWERQVYCKDKYYALSDDIEAGTEQEIEDEDDENEEDLVSEKLAYDVILVDIPAYDQENLTFLLLHRHLAAMMREEDSLLVVSSGSAPSLVNQKDEDVSRDVFIRQLTRPSVKGGLAYQFATVYDEPLAVPLASAFILGFQSDASHAYDRFFRTNSATFDLDMIQRLVPNTGYGRPPTVMYDGPTHMKYQTPSRNWEHWYCRTSPGKDLPGCTLFTNWMFDPSRHHKSVERRSHPVKGRSLHATEFIPKDHFVNFDDIIHSIAIDQTQWEGLVEFVENYPDADMYRQLRDFFVIYGFESRGVGLSGWAVSSASTNTFTNHACTDEDITVTTVDYFASLSEDGYYSKFSPLSTRRPRFSSYTTTAKRDIQPGEEIQMNYQIFRSDYSEHQYYDMFLTDMCSTGVGMVSVANITESTE